MTDANGVSADGLTIVGSGFRNGYQQAFVAVVPEPAALGTLAFLGVFLSRRRRAKLD